MRLTVAVVLIALAGGALPASTLSAQQLPLAIVPLLALGGFVAVARQWSSSWRSALMTGAVTWGVALAALTEVLSLARALTANGLLVGWSILMAVATVLYMKARRELPRPSWLRLSSADAWVAAGVSVVSATTLLIALAAAPNTFDSMTYHMARVAHWAADRSVQPYPTHILRQLHLAPWAEFAILHLQILAGSDRLANLVQWLASIGCAAGASLLAAQLGASRKGQLLAAAFVATLPMGILQATSTQNDYVEAFWLVCVAHFVLLLATEPAARVHWVPWLALGGSTGLALLTKPTGYIFAAPLLLWLAVVCLREFNLRLLRYAALAAAFALMLNVGHFSRNFAVYGAPLGPGVEDGLYTYRNDPITLPAILSNLLRNAALHTGTPSSTLNGKIKAFVEAAHRGLGIAPDDPRTSWMGLPFEAPQLSFHEDSAGNPLHLSLAAAAFIWILCMRRWIKAGISAAVRPFSATLLVAFVLFSAYLKWQPWSSRLLLPLFILAAAPAALMLQNIRSAIVRWVIASTLFAASIPWVLFNDSRPLAGRKNILVTPRAEQYFANWEELGMPYREAAAFLGHQDCANAGLVMGWDIYEYPFWPLLQRVSDRPVRMEHVLVENESATDVRPAEHTPVCAIVSVYRDLGNTVTERNRLFASALLLPPVRVYLPVQSTFTGELPSAAGRGSAK